MTARIENPFWDIVEKIPNGEDWRDDGRFRPEPFQLFAESREVYPRANRKELAREYAWAIPHPDAIVWMVEQLDGRAVVEIGAGTGYWAWLLSQHGVDVYAYDEEPPNELASENTWHGNTGTFCPVMRGVPHDVAACYPDRVLFLCWPPYADAMAADTLRRYRGDTLLFCGEGEGGCTGDEAFHELLAERWELIAACPAHVQWWGIHDELLHYRRKP